MDAGIEGGAGAPQGLQAETGDLVCQARQARELLRGQVAQGGDELGAVDEGQALLGLQDHGAEARLGQGLAAGQLTAGHPGQALAHQHQGHVGQGGEIAAGTHAALAGHHGQDAAVEALGQQADGLGADAAVGLQQAVDAGGHEGASLVRGQGLTHPGRMAAQQVELEQPELIVGDDHRGELAEAGVDAVDGAVFGHDLVHHRAVRRHPGQGRLIQDDALAGGDARQQGRREGAAVQEDHQASLGFRVRASISARPRVRPATV